MKHSMKYFLLGLIIFFVLAGLIFYNRMLHAACMVSLLLALLAGGIFTLSLNKKHIAELEQQEDLRKRLTSDVAHELRTPLAAISANLEAFVDGALEPTPERLNNCYHEMQRLSNLVADMERLAKTENEILNLNKQPLDLLEVARSVFEAVDGEPVTVSADRARIVQVLTNLCSNSKKYGGSSVTVTVREKGKYGEIIVADHGEGISPEDLPHIFERFYRADKSRNRSKGGAGIGLAIVKSIIDAHGGTIRAESVIGAGSQFTVRLKK